MPALSLMEKTIVSETFISCGKNDVEKFFKAQGLIKVPIELYDNFSAN